MSLTNSQYNELMNKYSHTRFTHQHELEKRLQKIYSECPRIKELCEELPVVSASIAKARLTGDIAAADENTVKLTRLREERDRLLKVHNHTPEDLQIRYTCKDCRDTGYISPTTKCHCMKQAGIHLLYEQSRLRTRLETENFDSFNLDFYSSAPNKLLNGRSNREHMAKIRERCRNYADTFGQGSPSLLIFGSPGVGKSFLSNCIAKVVLDRGFSVLYLTAPELFEAAARSFSYDQDSQNNTGDYVLECDLLILDDLGTENQTAFKVSHLFHVINSRLLSGKATIISTNLYPDDLQDIYSERISSRLMGYYESIPIFGDDIRVSR